MSQLNGNASEVGKWAEEREGGRLHYRDSVRARGRNHFLRGGMEGC